MFKKKYKHLHCLKTMMIFNYMYFTNGIYNGVCVTKFFNIKWEISQNDEKDSTICLQFVIIGGDKTMAA